MGQQYRWWFSVWADVALVVVVECWGSSGGGGRGGIVLGQQYQRCWWWSVGADVSLVVVVLGQQYSSGGDVVVLGQQ